MEAIANTLGLNVPGLIWHAVNFIVLLFLLRLVLFKPVVGMLDARAQRVRDSMEQADAARRAAEQAEADRQALLAETRREAEAIRSRADEQAKRILADADVRAKERQQLAEQQPAAAARQIEERVMAQGRGQRGRNAPRSKTFYRPRRRWAATSCTSWPIGLASTKCQASPKHCER